MRSDLRLVGAARVPRWFVPASGLAASVCVCVWCLGFGGCD